MPTTTIDYYETDSSRTLDVEVPMICEHCKRPSLYDYSDEKYHHAVDAASGCFLIPAEDRPDDLNHPLVKEFEHECGECGDPIVQSTRGRGAGCWLHVLIGTHAYQHTAVPRRLCGACGQFHVDAPGVCDLDPANESDDESDVALDTGGHGDERYPRPIVENDDVRVKLPPTFYDDHVSRDLPGGVVVKRTKRYVLVELTDDELREIRSDAAFYADPAMGYAADFPGIVSSARATVRAIDAIESTR